MFRKNLFVATIIALAMSLCTTASAFHRYTHDCWRDSAPANNYEFFVGLSYCYVKSDWCDLKPVFEAAQIPAGFTDSKCGVRAYATLNYTKYFGIEGGVTYIDRSAYNITFPTESVDEIICLTIYDLTFNTRVPTQNGFTYYFKFGIQYTMVKNGLTINTNPIGVEGSDQTNFNFTCGIGFIYPLTKSLYFDLGFQHFQGDPDIRNYVTNVGIFTGGLAYKFTL